MQQIQYRDRSIIKVSIILIVLVMVHLGRTGTPLEWIQNKDNYYLDILFSTALTGLIWFEVRVTTLALDKKYPWGENLLKRLAIQAVITAITGGLTMILLSASYAFILGIPVHYVLGINTEFIVGLVFIVVINLFYLILFLNQRSPAASSDSDDSRVTVYFGKKSLVVDRDSINYFRTQDKIVFCYLGDARSFRIDLTLEELEQKFPSFFRLNRQTLAQKKAIVSYSSTPTRKTEVQLDPSTDEKIYVSQKKTSAFKNWMK